ncbi:hypothetical protein B0G69_2724 [Paraburkholderia sp. RAU2J]|nr:hypothetical protein B0G69_2724 [Paraburkholderia sp. RAU2J]
MNKFSGIDLHSNNSVVVVSDETDRVVIRQVVFDALTWQIRRQRFASRTAPYRFRRIRKASIGQCEGVVSDVLVMRFGGSDLLSLVEHTIA